MSQSIYFCVDLENRVVKTEDGDTFMAEQFKKIVERAAEREKFLDMTLSTQRFVRCGCDWDKYEIECAELDLPTFDRIKRDNPHFTGTIERGGVFRTDGGHICFDATDGNGVRASYQYIDEYWSLVAS